VASDISTTINSTFALLWAGNAHAISWQYSGSSALRTEIGLGAQQQTTWGKVQDSYSSTRRYVQKSWWDWKKQGALQSVSGCVPSSNHSVERKNCPVLGETKNGMVVRVVKSERVFGAYFRVKQVLVSPVELAEDVEDVGGEDLLNSHLDHSLFSGCVYSEASDVSRPVQPELRNTDEFLANGHLKNPSAKVIRGSVHARQFPINKVQVTIYLITRKGSLASVVEREIIVAEPGGRITALVLSADPSKPVTDIDHLYFYDNQTGVKQTEVYNLENVALMYARFVPMVGEMVRKVSGAEGDRSYVDWLRERLME
jgi:hypothetical protein